jgi:hypothetical protein
MLSEPTSPNSRIRHFTKRSLAKSPEGSGPLFPSAGKLTLRGEVPFRGASAPQLKKPAHGHRLFTAQRFLFHFRAARSWHAVGVSKSSELSRVSAPTPQYQPGMPDGPRCNLPVTLRQFVGPVAAYA